MSFPKLQVMVTHHNFLMRQALLLLACTQECQADDRERLEVRATRGLLPCSHDSLLILFRN